jgi:sigma-B regulation protein RsbU (phosphoserine phosphatase)
MNRILSDRQATSKFATLVYGVLSPDGRFVYSNAGHNPPVVVGQGAIERLTAGGPIAGAFPGAAFDQQSLSLGDGDAIVLFSDGITDACNASGEEFGDNRLLAAVAERGAPGIVIERLFDAVHRFSGGVDPSDDMTAAVVRRR